MRVDVYRLESGRNVCPPMHDWLVLRADQVAARSTLRQVVFTVRRATYVLADDADN
jgi:hypothetical protein